MGRFGNDTSARNNRKSEIGSGRQLTDSKLVCTMCMRQHNKRKGLRVIVCGVPFLLSQQLSRHGPRDVGLVDEQLMKTLLASKHACVRQDSEMPGSQCTRDSAEIVRKCGNTPARRPESPHATAPARDGHTSAQQDERGKAAGLRPVRTKVREYYPDRERQVGERRAAPHLYAMPYMQEASRACSIPTLREIGQSADCGTRLAQRHEHPVALPAPSRWRWKLPFARWRGCLLLREGWRLLLLTCRRLLLHWPAFEDLLCSAIALGDDLGATHRRRGRLLTDCACIACLETLAEGGTAPTLLLLALSRRGRFRCGRRILQGLSQCTLCLLECCVALGPQLGHLGSQLVPLLGGRRERCLGLGKGALRRLEVVTHLTNRLGGRFLGLFKVAFSRRERGLGGIELGLRLGQARLSLCELIPCQCEHGFRLSKRVLGSPPLSPRLCRRVVGRLNSAHYEFERTLRGVELVLKRET
mmetsp:Transcript_26880/g.81372  ORF Transcript_26880/g.81372 Transcript_26880/m.81372 type:complete len:471 (-) Transcript_26880:420-1832(-)|eukprot:scaffold172735_cov35-Tisochrysis_lutea.AAC.1